MKKIIYILSLLLIHSGIRASAPPMAPHLDFNTQYNCGEFVVFVNDADNVNINSIYLDLTISFVDSTNVPSFSVSSPNATPGYPVYTYPNIKYTDTAFFSYEGLIVLDSSDISGSTFHAYRFVFKNYTSFNNTLTFFNLKNDLSLGSPSPNIKWATYFYKNCGDCIKYPSRLALSHFISDIFWNDPYNEFGYIDLSLFTGYSTTFTSMGTQQKTNVTRLLNWLLNYSVSSSDYSNAFSTTIDSLALPHAFYAEGSPPALLDCPCKSDLLNLFHFIKNYLITNGVSTRTRDEIIDHLILRSFFACDCTGNYLFTVTRVNNKILIQCEPIYSNLPYLVYGIDVDLPNIYETLAYSYEFDDNGGASSWPFIQTTPSPISYDGMTHVFTYGAGFTHFDPIADFQSACELPCVDCLPSFAPIPGKKYLVSGWVKEASASLSKTSYNYPEITILCPSVSFSTSAFTASGAIIDGWQRIEGAFTIPLAATDIDIQLNCSTGNCYFDDIRVLPFDASMKSYVFDPVSFKLVAELDERNYATMYEYDEEGKLIRVKKETEKGIMTIKENRNNTKK